MSGSQKGGKSNGAKSSKADEGNSADRPVRKQRPGEIGRALRSVYDDTVREPVPDDFKDLLGKLS